MYIVIKEKYNYLTFYYWSFKFRFNSNFNILLFLFIFFLCLSNFAGLLCLFFDHSLESFALNTGSENGQDTTHDYSEQSKGDGGSEQAKSQDASEQGKSQSGDNKPPKKPKPKLFLDLSKSDADKDTEKLASCNHENYSIFTSQDDKDVEAAYCDFNPEKEGAHRAFDSSRDITLLCNDCHAILCKECVEIYSDEESPNN